MVCGPEGLSGDSGIDCVGPRGQSSVVFVYTSVAFVYNILESLSLVVSMIICSISISDMVVFQFASRMFRRVSLSMIADLTTPSHLTFGLPTLLCPAHTLLPLGCMGIFSFHLLLGL